MKKSIILLAGLMLFLAACGRSAAPTQTVVSTDMETTAPSQTLTPTETATATETLTPTPTNTPTPTLTPTPSYPPAGRGPTGFEPGVNPLTGLEVDDPSLLDRRPIVIKVENLPRSHRPQWGLSLADIVYEYYTELGATRFAAVYLGTDAEQVGPIRSGRYVDKHIVQIYKAIFVYGSAYPPVQTSFLNSSFANRLILETNESCPGLCRVDPDGPNLLVADTASLQDYLVERGTDNTRQELDGMFFQMQAPAGGEDGSQITVRYSGAIYNRWEYDSASGRYVRYVDQQNDLTRDNEVYGKLTDRLTGDDITASNVVMLCAPHQHVVQRQDTEVLDIILDNSIASYLGCDGETYAGGTGPAYLARDGQVYPVTWKRERIDSRITLIGPDGEVFPFKPGQTWFEVIGASSTVDQQDDGAWRFTNVMGQ